MVSADLSVWLTALGMTATAIGAIVTIAWVLGSRITALTVRMDDMNDRMDRVQRDIAALVIQVDALMNRNATGAPRER